MASNLIQRLRELALTGKLTLPIEQEIALDELLCTAADALEAAERLAVAVESDRRAKHKLSQMDIDLDVCPIEDRINALAETVETWDRLTQALADYREKTGGTGETTPTI